MKNARQTAILELINQQDIETQEALAGALRELGFSVTQATVSRDIKELRLIKVTGANGAYKYAAADSADRTLSDRFVRIFIESVISIVAANNVIVIKTLSGSANAAAEAVDHMQWSEIVGTMAGDNTIFVIACSNEAAQIVCERLNALIANK